MKKLIETLIYAIFTLILLYSAMWMALKIVGLFRG